MITALSMLTRAARLLRVKGADESLSAQEAADGLQVLNSMLDAWSIERLMIYEVARSQHTWTASSATRTIGSGGDFNTTRPIHIEHEGNFFRDSNNLDYPVLAYPREKFDLKIDKTVLGSPPNSLFFDGGFPTRTLWAYPIPTSNMTLFLSTWRPLQQFTSLTAQLSLPAGYQSAIEYGAAVWMAPEYGASAMETALLLDPMATKLKANIKAKNAPNMVSTVELPGTGRPAMIEQG